MLPPAGIIARKRDSGTLAPDQIQAFVDGLSDGTWSDAQVAAFAMAVVLNGMTREEAVVLTEAMAGSGDRLHWPGAEGPYLDKHSTGGVGDKVSLILAPWLAACGAKVPMISGRGLGHTGGTLDKLEAIPGYQASPSEALLRKAVKEAGCAIVGANQAVAPADRRLYAIRDVTATVESIALVVSSILSKKLAAGLGTLVLDVKCGTGAFTQSQDEARRLAEELVAVANGAGLRTSAVMSDMNQVLGRAAGNSLEVMESVEFLRGSHRDGRLHELCLTLGAEALCLGGLAENEDEARGCLEGRLASGAACEQFAKMVAVLGGPDDFVERADVYLPRAPVILDVLANRAGVVREVDVKSLGLAVVGLGGGRASAEDVIDHRVGLIDVKAPGAQVAEAESIAVVHAASESDARRAADEVRTAMRVSAEDTDRPAGGTSVIIDQIRATALL